MRVARKVEKFKKTYDYLNFICLTVWKSGQLLLSRLFLQKKKKMIKQ